MTLDARRPRLPRLPGLPDRGWWLPPPLRAGPLEPSLRRWLGVGLLLRLVLLPIGVSSDTLAVYWRAHVIAFDGTVFRDYLVNAGAHVVHAGWLWVIRPFTASPDSLWTDPWWWDSSYALEEPVMRAFLDRPDVLRHIALLKLPYLLADLAAGAVLLALVVGWWQRHGGRLDDEAGPAATGVRRAWAFWMLSPVGIYATMWFGRYESFPVLGVLLALLLLERRRPVASAVALGLAITMRTYPVALLPFLALLAGERWRDQARYLLIGLAPFVGVQVLGRALGAASEVGALADRGLTGNWLAVSVQPPAGPGIYLTPLVLGIILAALAGHQWGWWGDRVDVHDGWRWLVAAHLGIFVFSHFSVHWFMWITPAVGLLLGRGRSLGPAVLHGAQVVGVLGASLLFTDARPFLGALGGLGESVQTMLPPFLGVSVERAQTLGGLAWTLFVVASLGLLMLALRDAWLAHEEPAPADP